MIFGEVDALRFRSKIFQRGNRADGKRARLRNKAKNMKAVAAEREYLLLTISTIFRNATGTHQVMAYVACMFRNSTVGVRPIGIP